MLSLTKQNTDSGLALEPNQVLLHAHVLTKKPLTEGLINVLVLLCAVNNLQVEMSPLCFLTEKWGRNFRGTVWQWFTNFIMVVHY